MQVGLRQLQALVGGVGTRRSQLRGLYQQHAPGAAALVAAPVVVGVPKRVAVRAAVVEVLVNRGADAGLHGGHDRGVGARRLDVGKGGVGGSVIGLEESLGPVVVVALHVVPGAGYALVKAPELARRPAFQTGVALSQKVVPRQKRRILQGGHVAIWVAFRLTDAGKQGHAAREDAGRVDVGAVVIVRVPRVGRRAGIGGPTVVVPYSGEHLAARHLHLQQPVNLELHFVQDVRHAVAALRNRQLVVAERIRVVLVA